MNQDNKPCARCAQAARNGLGHRCDKHQPVGGDIRQDANHSPKVGQYVRFFGGAASGHEPQWHVGIVTKIDTNTGANSTFASIMDVKLIGTRTRPSGARFVTLIDFKDELRNTWHFATNEQIFNAGLAEGALS